MRDPTRESPREPLQGRGGDQRDDERDVAGVGELKAVTERILDAGAHYLQQGRAWLESATRREDMNTRRDRDWQRNENMSERERYDRGYRGAPGTYRAPSYVDSDAAFHDEIRVGWPSTSPHNAPEYGGTYAPGEYSSPRAGGPSGSGYGSYDPSRRSSSYRGQDAPARWEHPYEPQEYDSSHRGKAPRGYMRSDERILEDVCERLSEDPVVDASGIDVRCEGGRIVLEGQVPSRRMKHRAEDIADSVWGANDVENRIRVVAEDRGRWDARDDSGSRSAGLTGQEGRGGDATAASGGRNGGKASGGGGTTAQQHARKDESSR